MESSQNAQAHSKKFGTFKGVYLPSLLSILGVFIYLRLGWVVAHVGLYGTLAMIALASSVTFVTGLSIATTASNMKVKGGGAYFMISRSFGLEAGAAIGIPLYLAQTLGISFYLAGFAESLQFIFPDIPFREVAFASLIVLTLLAFFSANSALKIQFVIFILIFASLVSFFLGGPVGGVSPSPAEISEYLFEKKSFWIVFAVFFPAVTGIEAGISMSGDLKKPEKSLAWGTLSAVLTGFVVYCVIAWVLSQRASTQSLVENNFVLKDLAKVPNLIYAGLWGATLSSALGALLGAPRTLQAIALDRIIPKFVGRGFGETSEPRIATIVTFFIAAVGIYLGDLNVLAPILSMFFLASYGFLNLISAMEGMIGNPSWRPTFRVPWLLSIIGACACFMIMFLINAGASYIALISCVLIFFVTKMRKLDARWLDLRRALLLFLARTSIYALEKSKEDAKSWRPHLVVFSGTPSARWGLVETGQQITQGKGFMTLVNIVPSSQIKAKRVRSIEENIHEFLRKRKINSLVKTVAEDSFEEGAQTLLKGYGLGSLEPNTILLGASEKTSEERNEEQKVSAFLNVVRGAKRSLQNVLIFRESENASERVKEKSSQGYIDVWWGRSTNNATLMLAIAYLLQGSKRWRNSQLRLRTLVFKEEEKQGVHENLELFLSQARLHDVLLDVHLLAERSAPFDAINELSKDSEWVFLGMKEPGAEEDLRDYGNYYRKLLDKSSNFKRSLLCLAGEDISFEDVFRA